MIVTFVSQCEKKATKRTRRVLDTFANRIGNNTWQTMITQEGLLAIKKLLRRTASKNTAISCHWIRSRSRCELMWVVGNTQKFDLQEGKVPVHSTTVTRINSDDFNNWKYLPLIRALASMAALFHDWGKANARFQQKLDKNYKGSQADQLRHEWISCLLLKAFILNANNTNKHEVSDCLWLHALEKGTIDENALTSLKDQNIQQPLSGLAPTAKLLMWLVLTHHKLPIHDTKGTFLKSIDSAFKAIDKEYGYENKKQNNFALCVHFDQGVLANSGSWLRKVQRWAGKLIEQQSNIQQVMEDGSYRVILHHARLCLMLGDHYFSSQAPADEPLWKNDTTLIANTQKNKQPKQKLDQHLVGVYECAKRNASKLPMIEKRLASSNNTQQLRKKSPLAYAWQNTAAQKVRAWQDTNQDTAKGFFAVNMASTGCGKTYANAKIMMALSEKGDSLRFVLALGLRTLTVQTGDEYKRRIFTDTDDSDMAVLIGSRAIMALHAQDEENQECVQNTFDKGSQSCESLLPHSDNLTYAHDFAEQGLDTLLRTPKDRQLLYAPVLVCTIDHIIAATETVRGGRYILPALRLLSSDIVIDEIDDFTDADLIAIGRFIHLAGMLGRKVMISSATIPPALAQGYFNAYQEGWHIYSKTRTRASTTIGCAWIDEYNTHVTNIDVQSSNAIGTYCDTHNTYITKRVTQLRTEPTKRKASIIDCATAMNADDTKKQKREKYSEIIANAIPNLHKHHANTDPSSGLCISFGIIRVANIQPCVQLTKFFVEHNWPDDMQVRVMAYHSRQVLLLRHAQEQHLDAVLQRKEHHNETPKAFNNTVIRQHIQSIQDCHGVKHVIFLLVATPVEEIGRDHDFDWAIIEPSSYRSIIQLAGRVRRHRSGAVDHPNIGILQYNWRTIEKGDAKREPRFYKPGYETKGNLPNGKPGCMLCHDLYKIVHPTALQQVDAIAIDAIARIQPHQDDGKKTPMALFEHEVISSQLTHYQGKEPETLQGYLTSYWYLTGIPQKLNRFRHNHTSSVQLYRVSDSKHTYFTERDHAGSFRYTDTGELTSHSKTHKIEEECFTPKQKSRLWFVRNYEELIKTQAEKHNCTTNKAATTLGFGEIILDKYQQDINEYIYNDQLGLYKKEDDYA